MQNWQGVRLTKVQRARQILGTLSSQEFPASSNPIRALQVPCTKFQPLQVHRITLFQNNVQHHATHNTQISTRAAIPIGRNVTSSLKTATHTVVPARAPVLRSLAQFASMRKVQAQNCTDPFESQSAKCTAPMAHTHELVHNPTSNAPHKAFLHVSRLSSPPRQSASLSLRDSHQQRRHTPSPRTTLLRDQLTCVVLVTCVHTLSCPVAAFDSRVVCTSLLRTSPAVGPRIGHGAASRCHCSQVLLRARKVRSSIGGRVRYALVKRLVDTVSTRHAADATRDTTIGGKRELTKAERTMIQGASTLLSTPM